MNKKTLFLALAIVVILLAYLIIKRTAGETFTLSELGMRIKVDKSLTHMTYATSTAPDLITVLHMYSPTVMINETPCRLGSFFTVPKTEAEQGGVFWTTERLQMLTQGQGDAPPQVKEFENKYLVFEPSQSACSSELETLRKEGAERLSVWKSVATAKEIR